MDTVQAIYQIAVNPAIRRGRPYIVNTTVTVADIVIAKLYHQLDVDGIADWYGLTLPQIYAALAYYYDHKPAIEDQIREQIRRAEAYKEQHVGRTPALLSR